MTQAKPPTRPAFRAIVASLLAHQPVRRRGQAPSPPADPRLPEQRLLDAADRFGRILSGEGQSRRRNDAAAAGVRTVPPTDPADADAPVWVRRLADPSLSGGKPAAPDPAASPDPSPVTPAAATPQPRRRPKA